MTYDRRFTIYWLGQTLSGFGDAFALVALPLLVLEATGSVTGMGMVSAAGVAAQVVASSFSGTLIDRFDRRKTMMVCDLGRAIGYGFLPLMGWLGGHSLWVIYVTVIVGGVLSNVFSVGYMTAVPALVGKDSLHAANAKLQGSLALAYVLGSLAAGLVAAAAGPLGAIAIDAGTFLLSGLSLSLIRFDGYERDTGDGHQSFGAGLRFLLGHRLLRTMTLVLVVLGVLGNLGVGAGITDLMIFHVKSELGLDEFRVGLCVGITALGALSGAVAATGLSRRWGSGSCFLSGSLVQAAGLLLIGTIPHLPAAAGGGLLWGAGMMMRGVPMHSLRQSLIPPHLLGRVTALSWTAIFGASAIGTAVMTRIAAHVSAGRTMAGIGACVGVVALVTWFGPVRER